MKATKVLSLLLTAAMLLAVLPLGVWAESAASDFEYTITDGKVTITGYIGEGGDVVIPSEIEGYPVTGIGREAFLYNTVITSIVIPEGVTTIDEYAFGHCESMTSIILPESLTNIVDRAFAYCILLPSITIPESVTAVGAYTFAACESLTSITIPKNAAIVGMRVFQGCTSLTDICCEAETCPEEWNSTWLGDCTATVNWGTSINLDAADKKHVFLIPDENALWFKTDHNNSSVDVIYNADGSVTFTGSLPATWPNVETMYKDTPIVVDIENDLLSIDFTVTGGATAINFFFDDGYSNYYSYPINNTALSAAIPDIKFDKGSGDFCDGEYKLNLKISDLVASTKLCVPQGAEKGDAFPSSAIVDGQIKFVGIQVYSVNGATITVRDLSIVTSKAGPSKDDSSNEDASDELPEEEEKLEVFVIGDWRVSFDNGEAILVNYIGDDRHVAIPSYIEGCPVTTIENGAFFRNTSITNVTIPYGVTSIGELAFYNCSSLTNIVIPNSVTSIGNRAFEWCISLTSVTIPGSVTNIEYGTFYSCTSLTSIVILDGVTNIIGDAFGYCESLTSITIPNSVTSIGNGAFSFCSSLTSVTIPDSVTSIGNGAFSNCTSLTSVIIPDSVISIESYAFSCCTSLTTIDVEDGNAVYYSKDNCIIEKETGMLVQGCNTSVIPDGVTVIGNGAFYWCDSMTSVTIPDSVTSIDEDAFFQCESLISITIPNSVTNIGRHAFSSCYSLTSIVIPDSVTNIDVGAFSWCESLTDIYCEAESQPEEWNEYWLSGCEATIHWGWKGFSAGDANGDDEINSSDATCLLKYLANYDYANSASTVEIGDNADCNGDGIVDGRDVVRLLQYLANRDPLTGESDVELGK